jgi:hypothetical protein
MRVEIDGQIRGILKTFGLVVGSGNKGAFAQRARMLALAAPVRRNRHPILTLFSTSIEKGGFLIARRTSPGIGCFA